MSPSYSFAWFGLRLFKRVDEYRHFEKRLSCGPRSPAESGGKCRKINSHTSSQTARACESFETTDKPHAVTNVCWGSASKPTSICCGDRCAHSNYMQAYMKALQVRPSAVMSSRLNTGEEQPQRGSTTSLLAKFRLLCRRIWTSMRSVYVPRCISQ